MPVAAASDGARVSYSIDGPADGAPLLLINSIGSTRAMWDRNVPALAAHFRVIRYDARGHGASSVPEGDYSIERLGRDAEAVLDAAAAPSAHICGISLGGLTAMWLAVFAPGRVARLVLANTAARIGSAESWTERIALVKATGMRAAADIAIPNWFTPEFAAREPDTVQRFRTMLESCPVPGYLGCCAALRDADLREAIAGISAPALVIGGLRDRSTTIDAARFLRETIPGARIAELDTAHLSNVERADEFSRAILQFLQGGSA
jgi:3-oxoadipate enol-lactonase